MGSSPGPGNRFEPRLRPRCHQVCKLQTADGCKYVGQSGSAAMLAVKRLAGVAPEVNLRNSAQARKHASKSTLALKHRADITRSPKRVSVAPQKGHVSSKNLKKKKKSVHICA